ncbi:MAG TPA: 4Fe-4S binding protein [Phycisphaerae bacterium]|nr:4Fe-4S binding protein [Phycisphaerae bacterium]HUU22908.1 4Fe-4S binding protein [Phycisphaerae bacterium]
MSKLPGWRDVPLGGIIFEAGNSDQYHTGSWRAYRPVHVPERCVSCLRCWVLCPDSAVLVEDGEMAGFDYDHCKGCGLCARECPPKCHAIEMVLDRDEEAEAAKGPGDE